MTQAEKNAEFAYRYQERIALMVGDGVPTPAQFAQAETEARNAVAEIVYQESLTQ